MAPPLGVEKKGPKVHFAALFVIFICLIFYEIRESICDKDHLRTMAIINE